MEKVVVAVRDATGTFGAVSCHDSALDAVNHWDDIHSAAAEVNDGFVLSLELWQVGSLDTDTGVITPCSIFCLSKGGV